MEVNMTEIPMENIEQKFSKFFDSDFGGYWKPNDCRPRWKVRLCFTDFYFLIIYPSNKVQYNFILALFVLQVAILIPFRNRHEHLPILFQHLIPMLQSQRLQFAFYVIEQVQSAVCVVYVRVLQCNERYVIIHSESNVLYIT